MKDSFKEEALQFIEYNPKTKLFLLNERAETFLKSLDSPFAIISVAGVYRTGKSFLINRMFLNQKNGFSVGPSVNPCTKGLWIWSKPIVSSQEDGTSLNTLVIDTEGFGGGIDEDQNHDIKIFTLAILLSSFFIYNSSGIIDETSLNSLNFIINLTKFIELKTNLNNRVNGNNYLDELSEHFPSFLWVLRDFSLQLVNDNKENMPPKEYMEKVLDNQSYGINLQDNDSKNRVRKMIKTFFKDRDCFTLIRPFTNEKQLQNNDNIDQLRSEFLEQINVLKTKILNKIKPKNLKGKIINGEMYVQIIKSYINAMNSGLVPNIENTWMNLCKTETNKAFEESEKIYENVFGEKIKSAINNNQNFLTIHQDAKKRSLDVFKKKSIGEIANEYEKILKKKIKDKFDSYSKRGEEEQRVNLTKILESWYSLIQYKLNTKEFKTITEIETDFKQIEQKVNDNFNQFRLKNEIFLSYKYKVLSIASEHFSNNAKFDNLQLSNRVSELTTLLQKDKNSNALKIDTEMNKLKLVIDQLKFENFEIKQQFYTLKDNYSNLLRDKENISNSLNEKILNLTEEMEKNSYEIGLKLILIEEKRVSYEKKISNEKNEIEREKSLLQQRIEQYAKQIEDQSRRSQENLKDFQSQMKEQTIANNHITSKYENQIQEFKKQIEDYKDKIIECEAVLTKKENLFELESSRLEEIIMKAKIENSDLDEKNNLLKNKMEQQKNMYEDKLSEKESDIQTKISMMRIKNDENELKFRNIEDGYKTSIEKNENEIAILKQNIVFLELQLNDSNTQLKDQKQYNETLEEKLDNKTSQWNDELKNIEGLRNSFSNEKKDFEENHEKMKTNLKKEIEFLNNKLSENENKYKNDMDNRNYELSVIKRNFDDLKRDYEITVLKNKNLSENISKLTEEYQSKLKILSREYERKLEEKELKHENTIQEIDKSTEETMSQIKIIYDNDKNRLEEKIVKERENFEFRMNLLITDYESKLRVQESEFIEQMDNLNVELNNQINNNQLSESTSTHKISLLEQKIQSLEEYLRESKENFNKIQENNSTSFDNHMENVKKEREELLNKIENLNYEISDKNREISSLNYKQQQLNANINEKEEILNKLKKNYENEKKDLTERLDQLKIKNEQSNDEFNLKRSEILRENALSKQQIEFLDQKIENLQIVIQTNQQKYEDRLFSLRGEIEKDYQERIERINQEKTELDNKLNLKKKEIKDIQNSFLKQIQLLEKEKTALNEKLVNLETKKKELVEKNEKEILTLTNQITSIKKDSSVIVGQNNKEMDTLRLRITGLEKEINEKKSSNEKEKMLYESKLKFMENQKEQSKKESTENQKKYEVTLENLHKRYALEKEKIDIASKNNISSIESKYQTQIKELNETYSKINNEFHIKIKSLENDLVIITSQSESKDKWKEEINVLNKKINDQLNNNDNLTNEIENQKRDKENKLNEFSQYMEKERESSKNKISELEKKLSESESKKSRMILEFEREKSKFFIEKDQNDSKIRELHEINLINEKKIENLVKDIDKLKNQKNNQLLQSYYSNNAVAHSTPYIVNHNDYQTNQFNLSSNNANLNKKNNKSGTNFNQSKDSELYNSKKKDGNKSLNSSPFHKSRDKSNYSRSPLNLSIDENEMEFNQNENKKSPNKEHKNYSVTQNDNY